MAMEPKLNTFVGDITASQYWSGLAQYGVGFGSWSGQYNIAGAPPQLTPGFGSVVGNPFLVTTNLNVEATLVANLGKADANGNVLPKPDPASTLYLVFLPPGDPFNFTDAMATYFAAASYSVPGTPAPWTVLSGQHAWNQANNFAYAVIPYPGAVGGGYSNPMSPDSGTALNFLTVVSSHEMVEAATDARAFLNPNHTTTAFGWYFSPPGAGLGYTGGGTEIGDPLTGQNFWATMSNFQNPAVSDSWYVQLYWSNFIPLSTAPHHWPMSVPSQPSVFNPCFSELEHNSASSSHSAGAASAIQQDKPDSTNSAQQPEYSGRAKPGPAGDRCQSHEPERSGRSLAERRGDLDQRRGKLEHADPVPDQFERRLEPRLQQGRYPLLVLPEFAERRHHYRDSESEHWRDRPPGRSPSMRPPRD